MYKVTHSDKNITPFGGLNFIYGAMYGKGLDKFFDAQLGYRPATAIYSHADIVFSLFGNAITQGSCLSDLQFLKENYSCQVFGKIPSPDTVEYVCQGLKERTVITTTGKGVVHEINYSDKMNKTLVALAIKTGQLKAGGNHGYTLDYDNVVIEHDKQDGRYSYKKTRGYHPGLGFIGRIPVHIENHNGNTPAVYQQGEILGRCFENLAAQGISVTYFRGDSAAYQKDIIALAVQHNTTFYIRIDDSENLRRQCGQVKEWKTILINNVVKEVASIDYKPFKGEEQYRVTVTRKERRDKQIDMESGAAYDYYGIITNDFINGDKEVITFYNLRGDDENSNRYMLNDFNLHHLPFPDMCTNTVFMYLMAMCATLFEWIKTVLVDNKAKGISLSMRIKAVCFRYITVAATFIRHAGKTVLKMFTSRQYVELKI